jgi:hypothetical protein
LCWCRVSFCGVDRPGGGYLTHVCPGPTAAETSVYSRADSPHDTPHPTHSPTKKSVRACETISAYHFGERVLAEVDVVLPPSMPLEDAHDVGQKLQVCGGMRWSSVCLGALWSDRVGQEKWAGRLFSLLLLLTLCVYMYAFSKPLATEPDRGPGGGGARICALGCLVQKPPGARHQGLIDWLERGGGGGSDVCGFLSSLGI